MLNVWESTKVRDIEGQEMKENTDKHNKETIEENRETTTTTQGEHLN